MTKWGNGFVDELLLRELHCTAKLLPLSILVGEV